MKKLVYLANAYSSHLKDPDAASHQRHTRRLLESYIGGRLKKKYNVTLILPIAVSAAMVDQCNFGSGFDTWEEDDYRFIEASDEVWVLMSDGWRESIGVKAEIKFANSIGTPVKYLNEGNLELTTAYLTTTNRLDEWGI